jgi:hypothetical protein
VSYFLFLFRFFIAVSSHSLFLYNFLREFCVKKPGENFNGVTMPDNKTVLDGTANAASVLVFMTYLSERHCKSGKGAGKDVLDKKSLEVAMEALADLKVQQMALEPHRFPTAEDRRYSFYVLYY